MNELQSEISLDWGAAVIRIFYIRTYLYVAEYVQCSYQITVIAMKKIKENAVTCKTLNW